MATEATIQTISKALGEADAGPLAQIRAVVEALGDETCLALLAETDRIEKAGGMERGDGKGRRSAGGVFFYLARQKLPKEQRAAIFNDKMPREPKPPGWVPEQKRSKDSERNFPRRRVFEVNPGANRFGAGGGGGGGRSFGSGPGSHRGNWTPPATPPGMHIPPQLPNAVARGKAKLGILDALGSLHPDDQYLVLLELLGDLHAVYGASADTAAPDSKSVPESKSTPMTSASVGAVASAGGGRSVDEPNSSEPPPSPKRKAPVRKSAKSS
ncbi:MAG TPA: phosphorylated adapter RNA export RNA-binding domain-containing protein [Polyangiaceae bacterium]|nr:phosphorylated adapter RNA export RNA-binding domain-containing protein [Polyangiaceae bacterium]